MADVHEQAGSPSLVADDAIVWQPSAEYIARSRLRRFIEQAGNASVADLRTWAVQDIGRYWDAVVKDLGFVWNRPYTSVLNLERGAPWANWFEGGEFNYVGNAVDRHANGEGAHRTAILWEGDSGDTRSLTYGEVQSEVNRFANALRDLGVGKGDRVGIFLPMVPEAVIATLACGRIGAIFIPLFSGYGADAVATRLRDGEASVLITADAFPRRGKTIPMKEIADTALQNVPSVRVCITLQRTGADVAWALGRDHWWHELVVGQPDTCEAEITRAADPYMIIYTSGTTGRPKGTVHVHAGFPIKAAHDLAYCFDVQADDTVFWLSDLGWMMGPWLIAGGLMLNATLMLYEGTPDYPNPDRLWQIVETHGVTVLGVAPTAIRALKSHGESWVGRHDLSSLRVLGSTGETWNPASWRWFFEHIGGGRCPIINYSGGTEISGGILGGFTIEPIKSCSFVGPIPGMDVDVVDAAGESVRGAVGELVIRQPWVGMTQGFWRDSERYLEAYWSRFSDVWTHGDWTEIDEDGFWYIRGRSDDVLTVSGKRVGPAELESAAAAHPDVQESAAIGVPHPIKGEAIHLFVVLHPETTVSLSLEEDIRQTVRRYMGAAMQPDGVHIVGELPRTRNGKIMRRIVRSAFLGLPSGEASALENPDIVDEIANLGAQERDRTQERTGDRE